MLPNGHVAPCKLGDVSSETYTMEAIVDERDAGGGVSEYRVKWVGQPNSASSWKSREYFKGDGDELIAAFEQGAESSSSSSAEDESGDDSDGTKAQRVAKVAAMTTTIAETLISPGISKVFGKP